MRFLHISDLHIGKRVSEFPMIEDQKYILGQILDIARDHQVQGVLIAGDIYDRQSPSGEAVQVFDWFLTSLADQGKKVFVVSGNHDSPERLSFGARLMRGRQVYVAGVYDGQALRVELEDEYGALCVHLLPFLKPAQMRYVLEKEAAGPGGKLPQPRTPQDRRPEEENGGTRSAGSGPGEENRRPDPQDGSAKIPESYQEAVSLAVSRMETDRARRNILVAHQFVTGAGRCESEEVAMGGLDNVDAEIFEAFDYVALGHIHSPQWVGRESVRYCGTPLKYSFSEAEQEKSVTVVTLKEKGNLELSLVPLRPLRDLRRIRGTYMEVTHPAFYQGGDGGHREDYLQITLTDEEDVIDGFMKLRTIYPNLMRLTYDNSRTRQDQTLEAAKELEQKSELELFEEFYELQNNQPMSGEQRAFVRELIESCAAKGGEV